MEAPDVFETSATDFLCATSLVEVLSEHIDTLHLLEDHIGILNFGRLLLTVLVSVLLDKILNLL